MAITDYTPRALNQAAGSSLAVVEHGANALAALARTGAIRAEGMAHRAEVDVRIRQAQHESEATVKFATEHAERLSNFHERLSKIDPKIVAASLKLAQGIISPKA